jgi:hypothetical protein
MIGLGHFFPYPCYPICVVRGAIFFDLPVLGVSFGYLAMGVVHMQSHFPHMFVCCSALLLWGVSRANHLGLSLIDILLIHFGSPSFGL